MKSVYVVAVLILLFLFLLGIGLLIGGLFPTPDPASFAAGLGVPGA